MKYKREDVIEGIKPILELLSKGNMPLDMAEKHLADHIIALLNNNIIYVNSPIDVENLIH